MMVCISTAAPRSRANGVKKHTRSTDTVSYKYPTMYMYRYNFTVQVIVDSPMCTVVYSKTFQTTSSLRLSTFLGYKYAFRALVRER